MQEEVEVAEAVMNGADPLPESESVDDLVGDSILFTRRRFCLRAGWMLMFCMRSGREWELMSYFFGWRCVWGNLVVEYCSGGFTPSNLPELVRVIFGGECGDNA